eukprot:scaffold34953_cov57-Phaeocystis_antarctica.AAC.1
MVAPPTLPGAIGIPPPNKSTPPRRGATPAAGLQAASHARPRNEVVDLDSRSVLPSGPWGVVVGFRRRGLVC